MDAAGVEKHVDIIHGDGMAIDLSAATVIFLFMALTAFDCFAEKLIRECKSGTRIVTYLFPLPKGKEHNFDGWFVKSESVPTTRPNGIDVSQFSRVYLYKVP